MALVAACATASSAYTRRQILDRLQRAVPFVIGVVVIAGTIGYFISGRVGLMGSTISSMLWGCWLSITWATQKRKT